jgi:hypothetical protein
MPLDTFLAQVEGEIGATFADTAKSAATCGAYAIAARRQMHDFFTRQMRGQRSIWRLAFANGRCREQRQFGFCRLQFFQRQFELGDLACQLFRRVAKMHPLQSRNLNFKFFD